MTIHDIGDFLNKNYPQVTWATVSLTARRIWRDYRGEDIPEHKLDEVVEAVLTEVKAKQDAEEACAKEQEEDRKNGIVYVPQNPDAYRVDWNRSTPEHPDDQLARQQQGIAQLQQSIGVLSSRKVDSE
jgi:hypothetical protein